MCIILSVKTPHPAPSLSILVVNFLDYKRHPEAVVEEVIRHVGADMRHHHYAPLPAGMKVGARGAGRGLMHDHDVSSQQA